jgi:hypothetical protein
MGLMDYSLLVGVKHAYYDIEVFKSKIFHQQHQQEQDVERSINIRDSLQEEVEEGEGIELLNSAISSSLEKRSYPAKAVIAPKEYYFGMIDILQTWSWKKKLERFLKIYLFGQPGEGISCIDPLSFKDRYQRKITRIIEHETYIREITGSWRGNRLVLSFRLFIRRHLTYLSVCLSFFLCFVISLSSVFMNLGKLVDLIH